jgi:hypothetical protein
MKLWRETHKEEKKNLDKEYRHTHKKERKLYDKTHKKRIKKQQKKRSKKCYLKHIDRMNGLNKKWKKEHPNEWREIKARNQDKRRGLGSISLNKWFKGSHRHHYDKEHVIFIPRELAFKWLNEHGHS